MLDKIIKHFGGQRALAEVLEVSVPAVSQWKENGIPAFRAAQIERYSGGKFKTLDILKDQLKKG